MLKLVEPFPSKLIYLSLVLFMTLHCSAAAKNKTVGNAVINHPFISLNQVLDNLLAKRSVLVKRVQQHQTIEYDAK